MTYLSSSNKLAKTNKDSYRFHFLCDESSAAHQYKLNKFSFVSISCNYCFKVRSKCESLLKTVYFILFFFCGIPNLDWKQKEVKKYSQEVFPKKLIYIN